MPWHPQILADQLTLSQPMGADYAHKIILAPPDFQPSNGPAPAYYIHAQILFRRIEVEDVHRVLFLAEVSPTNQVVPATIGLQNFTVALLSTQRLQRVFFLSTLISIESSTCLYNESAHFWKDIVKKVFKTRLYIMALTPCSRRTKSYWQWS